MPLDPEIARRIGEVNRRILAVPFFVFVWGPGPGTLAQRSKRERIRADLETLVGKDRVFFSEDDDLGRIESGGMFATEYAHVRAADAVVVIPETHGPLVEAALYQWELNGKSVVFVTKRDGSSFSEEAWSLLKVHEVEPDEWERCERVRRLARNYVGAMMTFKYRQQTGRFDWE